MRYRCTILILAWLVAGLAVASAPPAPADNPGEKGVVVEFGRDVPGPIAPGSVAVARTEPVAGVTGAPPSNNAALIVGVNQFHANSGLTPLRFAVNDAIAQAHLFVLELKLVPPDKCYLCLGGEPTTEESKKQLAELVAAGVKRQDAARNTVLDALLAARGVPTGKENLLLVSISTHGFQEKGEGRPYIMPSDGKRAMLAETAIDLVRVEQRMAESVAGNRLMIVDACREHPPVPGARPVFGDALDKAFWEALGKAQGQATLFSCKVGQFSFENEKLGHGIFTHFLVSGLRGAAAVGDAQFITIDHLARYLRENVAAYALANQTGVNKETAQQPWFQGAEEARLMPLAVNLKVDARRRAFRADVVTVSAALKTKADVGREFNFVLLERVLRALDAAKDDAAGMDLLANAKDFAEGRARESAFVAYVEKKLAPATGGTAVAVAKPGPFVSPATPGTGIGQGSTTPTPAVKPTAPTPGGTTPGGTTPGTATPGGAKPTPGSASSLPPTPATALPTPATAQPRPLGDATGPGPSSPMGVVVVKPDPNRSNPPVPNPPVPNPPVTHPTPPVTNPPVRDPPVTGPGPGHGSANVPAELSGPDVLRMARRSAGALEGRDLAALAALYLRAVPDGTAGAEEALKAAGQVPEAAALWGRLAGSRVGNPKDLSELRRTVEGFGPEATQQQKDWVYGQAAIRLAADTDGAGALQVLRNVKEVGVLAPAYGEVGVLLARAGRGAKDREAQLHLLKDAQSACSGASKNSADPYPAARVAGELAVAYSQLAMKRESDDWVKRTQEAVEKSRARLAKVVNEPKYAREAAELHETLPEAEVAAAELLARAGRAAEARAMADKIEHPSRQALAYAAIAVALAERKDPAAGPALERAVQLANELGDMNYVAAVLAEVSVARALGGDRAGASAAIDKALAARAADIAYAHVGAALAAQGDRAKFESVAASLPDRSAAKVCLYIGAARKLAGDAPRPGLMQWMRAD